MEYRKSLQNLRITFDMIRRNALANPMVYGGRYIQKSKKDAYIEYLEGRVLLYSKTLIGNCLK